MIFYFKYFSLQQCRYNRTLASQSCQTILSSLLNTWPIFDTFILIKSKNFVCFEHFHGNSKLRLTALWAKNSVPAPICRAYRRDLQTKLAVRESQSSRMSFQKLLITSASDFLGIFFCTGKVAFQSD